MISALILRILLVGDFALDLRTYFDRFTFFFNFGDFSCEYFIEDDIKLDIILPSSFSLYGVKC